MRVLAQSVMVPVLLGRGGRESEYGVRESACRGRDNAGSGRRNACRDGECMKRPRKGLLNVEAVEMLVEAVSAF